MLTLTLSRGIHMGNATPGFHSEFSIVIPTYNRRAVLVETLTALARTVAPWPCELIVVDDGSSDDSAAAARNVPMPFPTTVIEQPNAGAAAARNRGAAAAHGEFLLFLDDDMAADPQLLVEHSAALRAGADAVVGSVPLHPDSPPTLLTHGVERWARQRHERLARTAGQLTLPDLLTGQLSVRRTAFTAVAGFDTRFTAGGTFGAEDTDFLYRLLNSGLRARFAPGAVSYQRYVVTPEQCLRQWRQAGRADVALTRKHPSLGRTLAQEHRGRSVTGRILRGTAGRVPAPVGRAVTRTVLKRADANRTDLATQWAFSRLRDAQYWHGVHESGGLEGMRMPPSAVRVLAYHAIEDVTDPRLRQYSVPPEQFESQLMALAAAGFRFIGPEDLLGQLDGRPVPERSVLVSFDDGYTSNYDYAAPVLERMGIPAVLFMVTGRIGQWNTWDTAAGATRLPLMNAEQLTDLVARGWEIGAHTRAHAHLSALRPNALEDELIEARDEIVRSGLPRPRLLAYPYGEHNVRVRAVAKRAGYAAAFALETARATMDAGNRYAVPRLEVTRALSPEALVRLAIDPPDQRWRHVRREVRGAGRAVLTGVLPERLVAR
jgi:peptidoglycan/xylan/chitin deacetylase (PgdA/CDA1 family)/GT2 family glycosyltransferase